MRVPVAILLACLAAGAARADVSVAFPEAQRYTDASLRGDWRAAADDPALLGLRQHLQQLGARYLRPGKSLTIEVLDVDLAGRYEPWRVAARDVRIMREVTWPRIRLRYALAQPGRSPFAGEETVADQAYLMRAAGRMSGDPLFYEKAMLDDWFRSRFGEGTGR